MSGPTCGSKRTLQSDSMTTEPPAIQTRNGRAGTARTRDTSSVPTTPERARRTLCHFPAFRASPSELSDVTARLLYGCIHVKPVGPASGRSKRGESLRGTVEEPISSNRVSASCVRHGHTDLRKPLPQISFLNRPRLPTRLQHLVGGERTACLHERSSCFKCLLGRQGLLRHRLHPRSAVRQGPAQSVARPRLTSAAYGVPVTITPSHTTSLSSGGTGCAKEQRRWFRRQHETRAPDGAEGMARRPAGNQGDAIDEGVLVWLVDG